MKSPVFHKSSKLPANLPISSIIIEIYNRLCTVELRLDELLFFLKGIPVQDQVTLRDAIIAHIQGDRAPIEQFLEKQKQNNGN